MKRLIYFCWLCCACLGCPMFVAATPSTPGLPAFSKLPSGGPQVKVILREHGYHLGDQLVQHVLLTGVRADDINRKSLPLPGPVKSWLDLSTIEVNARGAGAEIILTWQLFATVETAQTLQLPSWRLQLVQTSKNKGSPSTINVPASTFYHSPVFNHTVSQIERKPTHPPLMYDLRPWQWLTGLSVLLSLMFAATALWIQDRLPWVPFRPGPLCLALRQLKRDQSDADAAVTQVYRALCQVAGVTLHQQNQSRLLASAPYLQSLDAEIEAFVCLYSDYKFGYRPLAGAAFDARSVAQVDAQTLLSNLMQWLPQAALLERSFQSR
jgi:hypothetical protein